LGHKSKSAPQVRYADADVDAGADKDESDDDAHDGDNYFGARFIPTLLVQVFSFFEYSIYIRNESDRECAITTGHKFGSALYGINRTGHASVHHETLGFGHAHPTVRFCWYLEVSYFI
jgi:hypothetical protein